jgi:7-cyano-7-deazaguanine synthase
MKERAVLLYSGGLDSTVMLYDLLEQGHEVWPIGIMYQQTHRREVGDAHEICKLLRVGYRYCYMLFPCMSSDLPMFEGHNIPDCHYNDPKMRAMIVPNRNMAFLSMAISYAIKLEADSVYYACHAGDAHIFPDCRAGFASAMNAAGLACDDFPVGVKFPYIDMTKAEVVRLGAQLCVPFEMTWTCYRGKERHCGRCGACVERREAFDLSGISDPTEYGIELEVVS